jgi:[protein-PII] uridylyltransferase
LISDVASVFASHGVSVRGAQIYTRTRATGAEAVDFFWVEVEAPGAAAAGVNADAADAVEDPIQRCVQALTALPLVADGEASDDRASDSEPGFDSVPCEPRTVPEIGTPEQDETLATITALGDGATHYLVTVESRDRLGLLHEVTRVLARNALEIASAHAATDRQGVAIDCFVVRHLTGARLSPLDEQRLRGQLLACLRSGSGARAAAARG